ncbi:MAG: ATP-binding protein [Candidatus Micrarchaeia archaeon]
MDKSILENIVIDQFEKISKKSTGYGRNIPAFSNSFLNHKINIIITGHRRVGKSTFLHQIIFKHFKDNFYYLDFSDERLIGFEVSDFQLLYEIFLEAFGKKQIFFFDEIQGKKHWDKFVNRMYEQGRRFFITGSNAELLSKEISTFLTGRHFDILIFPFSFFEFVSYNSSLPSIKSTAGKAQYSNYLKDFIKNGGFPEVVVYRELAILSSIYDDVINKDILSRYDIKDPVSFKKLSLFLISNFSKEFSYTSLKKTFGLGSTNTAKNYVSYLCNTYLLFEIQKYDYSLKAQENYSKKIYCVDTGLINSLAFSFSDNLGKFYENIVCIELLRRNNKIYFWKDDKNLETDFLILKNNKIIEAIQVCYEINDPKSKEREIAALLSSLNKFKLNSGLIINRDLDKTEIHSGKKIIYIPLWKWLIMYYL